MTALGLVAALVWWLWFDAWAGGMTLRIARLFRDSETGFRPPFVPLALGISASLNAPIEATPFGVFRM